MKTLPSRRLPAEWEPQAAVMLTWPHEGTMWALVLADVEPVFFAVASAIVRHQPLLIVCPSAVKAAAIERALQDQPGSAHPVVTVVLPSNDTWARDHGPITVVEHGAARILDFRFNGWGNKYSFEADNAITTGLVRNGVFGSGQVEQIELVLEGGSIDSDGAGSLMTTASCLLNPQRNAGRSRQQIEQALCELLGAERVLWLQHGEIEGDDTDGHIDMLARFCDRRTIVYQACDEPGYSGYAALQAMHEELQQLVTLDGEPYQLAALPWPRPKHDVDGARMPASYANFLLINGAVLVPAYDDPADDSAANQIQACFPDRELVQIDCLPLIQQHGSLHCLTMQLPKAVEIRKPDQPGQQK